MKSMRGTDWENEQKSFERMPDSPWKRENEQDATFTNTVLSRYTKATDWLEGMAKKGGIVGTEASCIFGFLDALTFARPELKDVAGTLDYLAQNISYKNEKDMRVQFSHASYLSELIRLLGVLILPPQDLLPPEEWDETHDARFKEFLAVMALAMYRV